MEKPKTYCEAIHSGAFAAVHRKYHDTAYGFPISSDDALFGRLILEINQAGLSWTTILNKEENFQKAYARFSIEKIAQFGEKEINVLRSDAGIIRNKLKINAAIFNAQKIIALQKEYGSFKAWLDLNHLLTKAEWVKLFKKTFKFTGGEITNEFLMSTGYLKGAHDVNCPIYNEVLKAEPMWAKLKGLR